MKIFVISNYRGKHIARPEAEIFIGLSQIGHQITIMTYEDAWYNERFRDHGIKVIGGHPTSRYDKEAIRSIQNELDNEEYDILHLFNNLSITNGLAAAKKRKIKIAIYRSAAENMGWYNPINFLKFYHPRIDGVVCNSEEIADKFRTNPFFKSEKAKVILKGRDISWHADVEPADLSAELNIEASSLVLVTMSNNRKVKGVPVLLEAMSLLPEGLDIHLIILGKDMDTPEHLKLIESSGYESRIHIMGYRKDGLRVVKASDVFILPSTGSESLTKALTEAMSMGLPVIATDLPGNMPVLEHDVNAYVIPTNDATMISEAILKCVDNKEKLSHMGEEGRKILTERLSVSKTVKEFEQFYQALIR